MDKPAPIVVIGLGNRYRGDDAFGPAVIDLLARLRGPEVRVQDAGIDPSDLILSWEDSRAAFVVDCVHSGGSAGQVFRFEPLSEPLPAGYGRATSTHHLGLAETIRLAQVLGRLPRQLVVYGAEGSCFEHDTPMTPAVAAAVDVVAGRVETEIGHLLLAAHH